MEAFDNDSIREYAARLMDKVQSQARDLEKMAEELERAGQYRAIAESRLRELQPDIELPLDAEKQAAAADSRADELSANCNQLRTVSEQREKSVLTLRRKVEKLSADLEKAEAGSSKQAEYISRLETRLLRLAGRAAVNGAPTMTQSPVSASTAATAAASSPPKQPKASSDGATTSVEELTGRFEEGLLQELSQLRVTVEEFGARAAEAEAAAAAARAAAGQASEQRDRFRSLMREAEARLAQSETDKSALLDYVTDLQEADKTEECLELQDLLQETRNDLRDARMANARTVAANAEMNDAVKALERALAAALAQAGSETARAGDLQNQVAELSAQLRQQHQMHQLAPPPHGVGAGVSAGVSAAIASPQVAGVIAQLRDEADALRARLKVATDAAASAAAASSAAAAESDRTNGPMKSVGGPEARAAAQAALAALRSQLAAAGQAAQGDAAAAARGAAPGRQGEPSSSSSGSSSVGGSSPGRSSSAGGGGGPLARRAERIAQLKRRLGLPSEGSAADLAGLLSPSVRGALERALRGGPPQSAAAVSAADTRTRPHHGRPERPSSAPRGSQMSSRGSSPARAVSLGRAGSVANARKSISSPERPSRYLQQQPQQQQQPGQKRHVSLGAVRSMPPPPAVSRPGAAAARARQDAASSDDDESDSPFIVARRPLSGSTSREGPGASGVARAQPRVAKGPAGSAPRAAEKRAFSDAELAFRGAKQQHQAAAASRAGNSASRDTAPRHRPGAASSGRVGPGAGGGGVVAQRLRAGTSREPPAADDDDDDDE